MSLEVQVLQNAESFWFYSTSVRSLWVFSSSDCNFFFLPHWGERSFTEWKMKDFVNSAPSLNFCCLWLSLMWQTPLSSPAADEWNISHPCAAAPQTPSHRPLPHQTTGSPALFKQRPISRFCSWQLGDRLSSCLPASQTTTRDKLRWTHTLPLRLCLPELVVPQPHRIFKALILHSGVKLWLRSQKTDARCTLMKKTLCTHYEKYV